MGYKKRKCKPRSSTDRKREDDPQHAQHAQVSSEQQKTSTIIDKLAKKYLRSESTDKKSTKMLVDSSRNVNDNLYDFVDVSSDSGGIKETKKAGKSKARKQIKCKAVKSVMTAKVGRSTKVMHGSEDASLVTPVTRSRKISITHGSNFNKPKRFPIKPIAQPNLDDISPILRSTASRRNVRRNVATTDSVGKRKLRSTKKVMPGLETPAVSFIDADSCIVDNDDSAIFVSPQKRMRFSTGKTSTPADRRQSTRKMKTTKSSAIVPPAKATSTPFTQTKPKPKRKHNKGSSSIVTKEIDPIPPVLSPVETLATPTSDYGSMEVMDTPSPRTHRPTTKKREESRPAFTLYDDSDVPVLNRSTNNSYKKTKKKLSKRNYSASLVEEWAEKVNSELEDIENFELSVEG